MLIVIGWKFVYSFISLFFVAEMSNKLFVYMEIVNEFGQKTLFVYMVIVTEFTGKVPVCVHVGKYCFPTQ